MTDQELLELAAKAAGVMIDPIDAMHDPEDWVCWNPINDDGDALRLAVDLRLIIRCYERLIFVDGGGESCDEMVFSDRSAATRRAIVRAAAEIGRAIP